MKDSVVVVGAGTSGLIAATKLAELGVDTTVYDQKKKPGFPVNASGILSISGLDTLGFDYSRAVTNKLNGAKLHVGREVVEIKSKSTVAYVLDRLKLNEICLRRSRGAGVKISVGSKVDGKILDRLKEKNIIIGADGVVSTVAKHFGFPPIEKHILTYRAEYGYEGLAGSNMVELFLDNQIFPGFFGWICPNSNKIVEIGVGIDSRYGNSKSAFERFLKFGVITDIVREGGLVSEGASIIPLRLRGRFVDAENEVLLVGDAAGQVKPTTGGGVIFGGNGALLAAKTVKNYILGKSKLVSYEKLWRKEFKKEIVLHSFFYKLYTSLDRGGLERVARMTRRTQFDRFLGKYGDMDRPSLILKRFFLRGLVK